MWITFGACARLVGKLGTNVGVFRALVLGVDQGCIVQQNVGALHRGIAQDLGVIMFCASTFSVRFSISVEGMWARSGGDLWVRMEIEKKGEGSI